MEGLIRTGCSDRVGPEPRTWVGRAQGGLTSEGSQLSFMPSSCPAVSVSTDSQPVSLTVATSSHAQMKRKKDGENKRTRDILSFIKIKINLVLDTNVFLKYSCFWFGNLAATHWRLNIMKQNI